MASVAPEILIVLLLIIANGIFAMSEIAVVSARKVRLQQRANRGDAGARQALALAEEPTRFLSTVQIGITLIGIFAGAFGGATIAQPIETYLARFELIAPYSAALSLGLVVGIITYLSLVIGELVPKRLALTNPENIAARVAAPMNLLSRVTTPLVSLLEFSTDLLLRLLGVRASEEPPVTEEEIEVLMAQGAEVGVFEEAEQEIVERLFRLGDRRANSLMTPRRRIAWIDLGDELEENLQQIAQSPFSRLLAVQGGFDHVQGIIVVRSVLAAVQEGESLDLRDFVREPLVIHEGTRAFRILELFQESGTPVALVIDEYGVLQGLLTLHDIMEGIVGELPSVGRIADNQIVPRADGSWLIDGMLPIDEFKEIFDIETLPGEDQAIFHTMGGFVMAELGRIPAPTDTFAWHTFQVEVVDMDGNRVDKILVTRTTVEEPPGP